MFNLDDNLYKVFKDMMFLSLEQKGQSKWLDEIYDKGEMTAKAYLRMRHTLTKEQTAVVDAHVGNVEKTGHVLSTDAYIAGFQDCAKLLWFLALI